MTLSAKALRKLAKEQKENKELFLRAALFCDELAEIHQTTYEHSMARAIRDCKLLERNKS